MKGISPVIATILLVGITVGVIVIVSVWAPGLITSQTEFAEEQSNQVTACNGVRILAETVTATSIIYSNPTGKAITNITVFDGSGRNITVENFDNLNPGQVGNVTWTRGDNTSILMTGICEDSLVVRGECEQGQGCWE